MSLTQCFFLAAIEPPPLPGDPNLPLQGQSSGLHMEDILLVVGVILILGLLLFVWFYMTHKKRRPQYTESGAKVLYEMDKDELEHSHHHHRRRRHRRPNHPDNLPRNPTLAEAGGLPPIRPDVDDTQSTAR